jgi:hypothetical protein
MKRNWKMVAILAFVAFALCLAQAFYIYGQPPDKSLYEVGLLGLLLILNAAWFFFKVTEGAGRWLLLAALIFLTFGLMFSARPGGKPVDVRYVLITTVAILAAINSGVFFFARR